MEPLLASTAVHAGPHPTIGPCWALSSGQLPCNRTAGRRLAFALAARAWIPHNSGRAFALILLAKPGNHGKHDTTEACKHQSGCCRSLDFSSPSQWNRAFAAAVSKYVLQPLKLDTACSKRTKKHMSNQWLLWHSHSPASDRSSFSYFVFSFSSQGPCCNFASSGLTRSNCDWAQSKGCPASESVPAFGPAISFSFPRFAPGPNNFGQKSSEKRKLFGQARPRPQSEVLLAGKN